ncbi:hypothetical protein Cgig2_019086 [Carnegiea gigantea]|uniref:Uncharacterized protein n=1 Tax=Carnegiea gigantea TaxID=171969 RepID=A0A9Q1KF06_9CARY|nr:hypothetical protein Cgig2_019086 [Carnegiea gigantea]
MGIDGGGGGGAVVAVGDDMGGDGMQCSDHPYRNNSSPGGICAFCLQEKLGKLVSSSSSSFIRSSTSSSSPSFRSEQLPTLRLTPCSIAAATSTAALTAGSLSLSLSSTSNGDVSNGGFRHHNEGSSKGDGSTRRARIPFLLTQKRNNKKAMPASSSSSSGDNHVVLKRSKSTATPRSGRYLPSDSHDLSPRRRGFWSFLHLSQKKPEKSSRACKSTLQPPAAAAEPAASRAAQQQQQAVVVMVDEADSSPNSSGSNTTSFGRKVSRSRSVGCGSRSFSGDFFERISTGFGDCTLRRVESQREGRRSTSAARAAGEVIKGRVPCGGLFGGFVITSSSSSSSWVSSAEDGNGPGRAATPGVGPMINGRNRNWAWAFASPRRAFGKTTTTATTTINKDGRTEIVVSANTSTAAAAPNLAAIPSLLAVRGCPIVGE